MKLRALVAVLAMASIACAQATDPNNPVVDTLTLRAQNPPQKTPSASLQRQGNPGPRGLNYWIVANGSGGASSPAGPFHIPNAPNALSSGNGIVVSWAPVPGATSYDVLRTPARGVPPSGTCNCAVATGVTATQVTDQSETLQSYTINTTDIRARNIVLTSANALLPDDHWNAWLTPGADICDSIVKSAIAMAAAGRKGGVITAEHWHGPVPCANALNGWPWTNGQNATFTSRILLSPDVWIQSAVRFVVPTHTLVDGQTSHGTVYNSGSLTGAFIGPSQNYTDNVIVELGAPTASGGVPPQGVRLQGIGVTCLQPNGTSFVNGTGILNRAAQEFSGWYDVHIAGCPTPFDIETAGIAGGSINGGSYDLEHVTMDSLPDSAMINASCGVIGTNSVGVTQVGSLRTMRCSCINGNGTQCPNAATLDANDITLDDWKLEGPANGILVGSAHSAKNVNLRNVFAVAATPSRTMANIVQISANNPVSIVLEGIRAAANGAVTNTLLDSQPAKPCTIPAATEATLSYYARQQDNANSGASARIVSTSSICNVVTQLPKPQTVVRSASYLAQSSDNEAWLPFSSASTMTLTLPATIPFDGWCINWSNYGTGDLVINPNGLFLSGSNATRTVVGSGPNNVVGGRICASSTSYHISGFPGLIVTSAAIGGANLASGACIVSTPSVGGAKTGMTAVATPSTYPGDAFEWNAYVSATDVVTVRMCNRSAAAATPGATTFAVRVK